MRNDLVVLSAALSCAWWLTGCCGKMTASETAPQTIQVQIVSASPASVAAGSGNFTLTITGMGLGMGTQVNFGTAMLAPSAVTSATCGGSSCEALTVTVPAADVAAAGTINVTVANSAQVSNSVVFTITPPVSSVIGAPQLLVFTPLIAPAGLTIPLLFSVIAENVAHRAGLRRIDDSGRGLPDEHGFAVGGRHRQCRKQGLDESCDGCGRICGGVRIAGGQYCCEYAGE